MNTGIAARLFAARVATFSVALREVLSEMEGEEHMRAAGLCDVTVRSTRLWVAAVTRCDGSIQEEGGSLGGRGTNNTVVTKLEVVGGIQHIQKNTSHHINMTHWNVTMPMS